MPEYEHEAPKGNGLPLLRWRVDNLEREAAALRREKVSSDRVSVLETSVQELKNQKIEVLNERMTSLLKEFSTIKEDVEGLRRTLLTFAFSIAGSAVLFAVTVFTVLK